MYSHSILDYRNLGVIKLLRSSQQMKSQQLTQTTMLFQTVYELHPVMIGRKLPLILDYGHYMMSTQLHTFWNNCTHNIQNYSRFHYDNYWCNYSEIVLVAMYV